MQIELSNGLNHVWQWDKDIAVTVPESVDSVHFRWGNRAENEKNQDVDLHAGAHHGYGGHTGGTEEQAR